MYTNTDREKSDQLFSWFVYMLFTNGPVLMCLDSSVYQFTLKYHKYHKFFLNNGERHKHTA